METMNILKAFRTTFKTALKYLSKRGRELSLQGPVFVGMNCVAELTTAVFFLNK